ncbi:MAG: HAMP domain-containing histidine kinase [Alistipes sp.]|nr:HAMP domain-containing histidine kinase [Alistipes sp.]
MKLNLGSILGRGGRLTFRRKVIIIVLGLGIGTTSLLFTNYMAKRLREKEQNEIRMWTYAMEHATPSPIYNPFPQLPGGGKNGIPYVIVDDNLRVVNYDLIPEKTITNPDLLRKKIDKLSKINKEVVINDLWYNTYYLFYGESTLLKMLTYFPLIQLSVIFIFIAFGYLAFVSTKHDEQNRVWIGLAKETAHQLGTPTSSLLGWLEYLRSQPVDQTAVEEMGKDLTRLMKVVDRFSKIGSETVLSPANINEVVGNSVLYFRTRVPKNVTIEYNGLAIAPVQAMVNSALFEWVVENLLKNSLDALQGKGVIDVKITSDENHVFIDVADTGRGVSKANFKRIFEPGFTTKTRGWGLGLSLSKRIIEDYHKGKIFVVDSEVGKGTTFRITLNKVYI